MAAQIVSLLRFTQPLQRDWSQQELAEFYRVEGALLRAGMRIETERGVTDDGDPWFAFCRAEDGEVFIHFARIDGEYLIAGPGYEGIARGRDFASLVRDLISRHPLVQPATGRGPSANNNIFLHPAALLIAVVATAFFKTNEAKADDGDHRHDRHARSGLQVAVRSMTGGSVITVDADQTLAVVASAMIALDREGSLLNAASVRAFADNHAPRADLFAAGAAEVASHQAPAQSLVEAPSTHSAAGSLLSNVGAWLALTVVLKDLAAGPSPIAAAEGVGLPVTLARQDAAVLADGAPTQAQAAESDMIAARSAAGRLFAVELSPGPLPDVAAIRVLHESGVDTGTVIQVAKLPTILADYIARGEHLLESQVPTGLPAVDHNATLPVPADSVGDALPGLHASADGDSAATDAAPAPAVEAAQPPTPAPAPIDSAAAAATAARVQHITDVIAYFTDHTAKVSTVVNNHQVVLYDDRVMTDLSVLTYAESVTFTFDDGSSISLIGAASALPDLHGLH